MSHCSKIYPQTKHRIFMLQSKSADVPLLGNLSTNQTEIFYDAVKVSRCPTARKFIHKPNTEFLCCSQSQQMSHCSEIYPQTKQKFFMMQSKLADVLPLENLSTNQTQNFYVAVKVSRCPTARKFIHKPNRNFL